MKKISYGIHSSLAAIQQRPFHIQEVFFLASRDDKRIQKIKSEVNENSIQHQIIGKSELEKICGNVNHQGVVVIYKNQKQLSEVDILEFCSNAQSPLLLLVLDQIVDPHNLGACLRTAEAAGVNAVISSTRKSASLTPTVHKVSSGASERIPLLFVSNLVRFLKELKQLGVWIYGTEANANITIYQADFTKSVALIIGAEGTGMRRLTSDTCDEIFSLPMQGEMASLNASVAAGIALFEAVRQRQIT